MTDAGVDVLTSRTVVAFWTDAARHAASPRRRPTDPGVEARSGGAAGAEARLTRRAAVAGRAEALERAVARVQTQSAVTTRSTNAGVGVVVTPVPGEPRTAEALSETLRAEETSSCTAN